MSSKKSKVLFVATSRKTMGGITSVLKRYEKMDIWSKFQCSWLETQINKGIMLKLWYMITSYITMLFTVPRYDIIHFHTTPGRSITIQMPVFIYSLLWCKKTIIHIHVGNQLLDYKNDKMFRFVLRNATKTVVLANALKSLMKEHYNIDAEVLYNPIEEQPPHKIEKREKTIFFAAYLTLNKGYDTLIKAFKEILKKHNDWRLIIAGSGETKNAKKMIKELGIENNVEMHAWLNKEQMTEKYQTAGIYCIASKQEGFPMGFLEAASFGIPIVTTPVGGLVDFIEDGKNCMIFNFDNDKELAEKIDLIIEDKDLYDNISNNLTDLTKKSFSLEAINKNLDFLYSKI